MQHIDINADLGEGCANDAALMALVSSANIACGWHAGDKRTMRETVRLSLRHDVAIGAHPSYPDRANFGRTAMARSPEDVYADAREQIDALAAIVRSEGGRLHHVKAHGALYTTAASDPALAEALARAVRDTDSMLALYGLAGSAMIDAARNAGLRVFEEIFADRRYMPDGTLVPRGRPDALITDADEALAQVRSLLARGIGQTICVHGDGDEAVAFASRLAAEFLA